MTIKNPSTSKKPSAAVVKPKGEINPPHYVITVKTVTGQTVEIETVDLIEALCPQDAHLAHAFTYITRAGKKKSTSYVTDVLKCAWWCKRAAKFHGGHPELDD